MGEKKSLKWKIKQWFWEQKFKRAKWALEILIAKRDPELYRQLTDVANQLAKSMCMKWLENKGIHHCVLCPNTEPLIKLNGMFYCAPHAGRLAKENGTAPKIQVAGGKV